MKIGSLFSGYGGLDLAVQSVLGGEVVWHVEFDKNPSKILDAHFPDVPNFGDVSKVDWAEVEPIDVLTGGFPCQDLSHAGKRKGLRDGTRSGLWSQMFHAIEVLQPRLVVIENVLGILSASAAGNLEPCPFCVGDATGEHLRALGCVLGDLAEIRYDARWATVRAADAGACHGRARVFILAYPADPPGVHAGGEQAGGLQGQPGGGHWISGGLSAPLPDSVASLLAGVAPGRDDALGLEGLPSRLLPTPVADNSRGLPQPDSSFQSLSNVLLPTPVAGDGTKASSNPETSQRRIDKGQQPFLTDIVQTDLLPTPTSRDHKDSLDTRHGAKGTADQLPRKIGEIVSAQAEPDLFPTPMAVGSPDGTVPPRLLPTPTTVDSASAPDKPRSDRPSRPGRTTSGNLCEDVVLADFGPYQPAIDRWASVMGRPAPNPTEPGGNGKPRLNAFFVEWMMGLPEGWVCAPEVGLSRTAQLKALGNGVVWQQASLAIRLLLNAQALHARPAEDHPAEVNLIPTPLASAASKSGPGFGPNLSELVQLLPTAGSDCEPEPEPEPDPAPPSVLLPTPAVNDMGDNKSVEWWDDWSARLEAKFKNTNGHGKSLAIELKRLAGDATTEAGLEQENLPTEPAQDLCAPDTGQPVTNVPDGPEPDQRGKAHTTHLEGGDK